MKLHPRFFYDRAVRIELGDGCEIKRDVRVGREYGAPASGPVLKIGPGARVLSECNFDCTESIHVGAGTHVGRRCQVFTHDHDVGERGTPVLDAPIAAKPVRIGADVMIYSDVVILPGVTVGDGAVVGVRSVVTSDVAPYSVVAGAPARKISERR